MSSAFGGGSFDSAPPEFNSSDAKPDAVPDGPYTLDVIGFSLWIHDGTTRGSTWFEIAEGTHKGKRLERLDTINGNTAGRFKSYLLLLLGDPSISDLSVSDIFDESENAATEWIKGRVVGARVRCVQKTNRGSSRVFVNVYANKLLRPAPARDIARPGTLGGPPTDSTPARESEARQPEPETWSPDDDFDDDDIPF